LRLADYAAFEKLGTATIADIQTALMDTVLTGQSDRNLIRAIDKILDKDFKRYAETYAQTSRNRFLQQSENIMAENIREAGGEVYWEYVGPEDMKNRDECIEALAQRFFTTEEMEAFEGEGIRWNCRHTFMVISPDAYATKEVPENALTDEENQRRLEIAEAMNG
jgi:hypothetical protein